MSSAVTVERRVREHDVVATWQRVAKDVSLVHDDVRSPSSATTSPGENQLVIVSALRCSAQNVGGRRLFRVILTFIVEATSSQEARAVADRGALAVAPTETRLGAKRIDFRIEDEPTTSLPDASRLNRLG